MDHGTDASGQRYRRKACSFRATCRFERCLIKSTSRGRSLTCLFVSRGAVSDGTVRDGVPVSLLEPVGEPLELIGEQVPVGVQRHRCRSMAELCLDRLDARALDDEKVEHQQSAEGSERSYWTSTSQRVWPWSAPLVKARRKIYRPGAHFVGLPWSSSPRTTPSL